MGHSQVSPRRSPTGGAARHALPRVVFVVGATSSGKTDLGLRLAKELNGEIVNADSRQIYKDVDIGTGKPKGYRRKVGKHYAHVVDGVPHYLMDFLSPEKTYSVADWRTSALKAIKGITKRGKLPIVVGGTGLYVSSLVDNYEFSSVPPQPEMRRAYELKSVEELARILLTVDAEAGSIVDLKNKRRVVRALEIITFSGKKMSALRERKPHPLVDALQVGIHRSQEELKKRLESTVDHMVEDGLFSEVSYLLAKGLTPEMPGMSSIGYRDIAQALNGEISEEEAVRRLKHSTRQYTKRQITWFKRDPRIRWVHSEKEGIEVVKEWLT